MEGDRCHYPKDICSGLQARDVEETEELQEIQVNDEVI